MFSTPKIRRAQGRTLSFAVGPPGCRSRGSPRVARLQVRHVDVEELAELPVFHRCDAEHHPYTNLARESAVHFAFPRALPIWPFRGRLCFAERGQLRWQMVRSLEHGSVESASRATLRDGLRGAGKRVVQFSYGGWYLLMGAALTTLV